MHKRSDHLGYTPTELAAQSGRKTKLKTFYFK